MTEWRIHLGAHKTATTHLQQTLAALGLAPNLEEFRSSFWRTPEQRRVLGKDLLSHRRWSAIKQFRHFTVISDENILCEAHEASLGFDLAVMSHRIGKLSKRFGKRGAKIFLAIRHPAEFGSSVYSETLRHHPEWADPVATRAAWNKGGQWAKLVETIASKFDLTVWRYEDYRSNQARIARAVAGIDLIEPLPRIPDPIQTQRLGANDIRAIEADYGIVRTEYGNDPHSGRFTLFSSQEVTELDRIYDEECSLIGSMTRFLRF